jgi:hypothetical protein
MAFNTQPVDFNYFLQQKYAILKQQADAGSESSRAQTTNAATAAITGRAAANLDNVNAGLRPGESAAQVGLTRAQTALTGNQAQVVIPMANAQIRGLDANTALTGTQNKVLVRNELTPQSELFGPGGLGGAGQLPSMFRFSEEPLSLTRPTRRAGETGVRYMDRTGWGPGYGAERSNW